jgi:phosphoenolpyruvate carboxykinase (ATP)
VPDDVLNPRATWSDKAAYDDQARDLCGRFHKNFEVFNDYVDQPVRDAGPILAV